MREPRRVTFTVVGVAHAKGNARAFVPRSWANEAHAQNRTPRAVVTLDDARAKGWQQLIAHQAQRVAGVDTPFLGPVVLTVVFHLPRPDSLPHKIRQHVKKPDLDKLIRCVADALTGVLFLDDKQIVDLHARKCYALAPRGPHATITLEDAIPAELGDGALFDHPGNPSPGGSYA